MEIFKKTVRLYTFPQNSHYWYNMMIPCQDLPGAVYSGSGPLDDHLLLDQGHSLYASQHFISSTHHNVR